MKLYAALWIRIAKLLEIYFPFYLIFSFPLPWSFIRPFPFADIRFGVEDVPVDAMDIEFGGTTYTI